MSALFLPFDDNESNSTPKTAISRKCLAASEFSPSYFDSMWMRMMHLISSNICLIEPASTEIYYEN